MSEASGPTPSAAPPRPRASRAWRLALAIAVGAAALRLLLAGLVPLFPDETYYWVWSRHLAASYFDHPFGVAVLIRAGTALLGDGRLGVRLFAVLSGLGATLAVMGTARRIADDRAALRASLILACMPLAGAGLLIATPDAPLLAFGALCLYFTVRALQCPAGSGDAWRWWLLAGLALGAALDCKYTAVLIPLGVLVALLATPRLRPRLSGLAPYAAAALGLALFAPVVVWNARHGWASFAFQLGHGLGRPRGGPLTHEGSLLGGQAGLVSPILFGLMAVATWHALRRVHAPADAEAGGDGAGDGPGRDDSGRGAGPRARAGGADAAGLSAFLAAVGATILGFFALSALRRPVEVNWPAPAYIAATTLLAVEAASPRWRRWLRAGLVLGGLLVALVYVQALTPVLPVPPRRDPVARAFGYGTLARRVGHVRRELETGGAAAGRVWIAADRYQDAAELAFHLHPHADVFSINLLGRPNQYDLWPGFPQRAGVGDTLILVTGCTRGLHPLVAKLAPHFRAAAPPLSVALRRAGRTATTRCITVLSGWLGSWP